MNLERPTSTAASCRDQRHQQRQPRASGSRSATCRARGCGSGVGSWPGRSRTWRWAWRCRCSSTPMPRRGTTSPCATPGSCHDPSASSSQPAWAGPDRGRSRFPRRRPAQWHEMDLHVVPKRDRVVVPPPAPAGDAWTGGSEATVALSAVVVADAPVWSGSHACQLPPLRRGHPGEGQTLASGRAPGRRVTLEAGGGPWLRRLAWPSSRRWPPRFPGDTCEDAKRRAGRRSRASTAS
jgi:hypothetical protein